MSHALRSLPGVANVEIDAAATTATATVDPASFVIADAIDALKGCGYPANLAEDLSPPSDPVITDPAPVEATSDETSPAGESPPAAAAPVGSDTPAAEDASASGSAAASETEDVSSTASESGAGSPTE